MTSIILTRKLLKTIPNHAHFADCKEHIFFAIY